MSKEIVEVMTPAELKRREKCEAVIAGAEEAVRDLSAALLEMRDSRLYRNTHKTFDDYCEAQWGYKRSRVYQLIDSARVIKNLGDITSPPTNEAQTRPLTDLPPEQQEEAWNEAVAKAPQGEQPTGGLVQKIVDRIKKSMSKRSRTKGAAVHNDANGWTEAELMKDEPLLEAFKTIAKVYGNDDTRAMRTGGLQFKRTDVLYLAKLAPEKMREIQDLIYANHWDPKKAVDFVNDMADDQSTVEDLQNWCLGTKDKFFTADIGGFTVTCKANRAVTRKT